MASEQCIFCKIVQGETSSEMVGENEVAIAFRDINPKAPVHVLIVPHEHHASLHEMGNANVELLGKLLVFARDIAERQGLHGYKVIANAGREGGQLVDHLHFHVLGGWNEKPKSFDV